MNWNLKKSRPLALIQYLHLFCRISVLKRFISNLRASSVKILDWVLLSLRLYWTSFCAILQQNLPCFLTHLNVKISLIMCGVKSQHRFFNKLFAIYPQSYHFSQETLLSTSSESCCLGLFLSTPSKKFVLVDRFESKWCRKFDYYVRNCWEQGFLSKFEISFAINMQMIVLYGNHILSASNITDLYSQKYKGIWICFEIIARALGGNYVMYAVFDLYGDPCLKVNS